MPPETPSIPELLAQTREALQIPPGSVNAPITLGGNYSRHSDQGLAFAVAERQTLATSPNDEISAAVLITLDVGHVVETTPVSELLDTIRTQDWRVLQGGHVRRAITALALGYDRARRKGLVGDLDGRYSEFITRIGGECLTTLALTGVVRHSEFYGDPSVHYSPLQIARWRADFPPTEIGNSRFLQALQRLDRQAYLMPNLLSLLRDHPMVSSTQVRTNEIISYVPEG